MSWLRQWFVQIAGLKRRWLGLIVGCLFWLVWMLFGALATVMLIVCATIGFVVGRLFEEHQSWKEVVDKLLSERYTDS
jgi:uncharacterized membrane protein